MKIKLRLKKEDLKRKLDIENGKDADEQKVVALAVKEVLEKVPVFPTEQVAEMQAELELLKEIKDKYEELEKKISELPKGRNTVARGFQLLTDGTKRGMANMLNIIGGTGVTVTYNYASGRNDVTLTTAGVSILTATGSVNGSNTAFTFTTAPVMLVVDGRPLQKTQSDGTVNWTGTTSVTLTVAPNFDVYGLG